MVRIWALALVLCVSPAFGTGFRTQYREEGGDADMQLNTRSAMIQYIIHKGCDYVSITVERNEFGDHTWLTYLTETILKPQSSKVKLCTCVFDYFRFVWSHYTKQRHDKEDHVNHRRLLLEQQPTCDWKDPVRKALAAAHVPVELGNALIDCGPAHSFHALQISDWTHVYSSCNLSVHDAHPVVVITGRRGVNESHAFLDIAIEQTLTMDSKVPRSEQEHSSTHDTSGSDDWLASDHSVQRGNLTQWCSHYSRRVHRKFHLDTKRFVKTSPHWLVDVYKMAKKFSAPQSYIHGLVGCGQKYALDAFGVPKRISLLYSTID